MDIPGWLIFVGVIFAIWFLIWLSDVKQSADKYSKFKKEEYDLNCRRNSLKTEESVLKMRQKEWEEKLQNDKDKLEKLFKERINTIDRLAKEKTEGFPWLAQAYSDYLHLKDLEKANYLRTKSHPAPMAAEQVREIAGKRRIAEKLYRVLEYKLKYYETLFPWLVDFTGEEVDDLIKQIVDKKEKNVFDEQDDAAKKWLTQAEYSSLSSIEKYQLALDRYWEKKKSKWEIGRDYERYIGYLYEKHGYCVYYQGIIEGFEDLGRDLICTKESSVKIIQCKNWSKEKTIHEKHIFQLFGTVLAYKLDHSEMQVIPWFITSTALSEKAKRFAKELGVKWLENQGLEHYPCIKCNVSRRDGARIYHLPFDQQYDRTLVEEERNEFYVEKVEEAEALGFRRAFRWRGETSE